MACEVLQAPFSAKGFVSTLPFWTQTHWPPAWQPIWTVLPFESVAWQPHSLPFVAHAGFVPEPTAPVGCVPVPVPVSMKYPRPLSTTGVPVSAQEVPASSSTGGAVDVGAGEGVVEVGVGAEVEAGGGVFPAAGAGPPLVRFPSPGGSGVAAPDEHAASSQMQRRRTAPDGASKHDLAMLPAL